MLRFFLPNSVDMTKKSKITINKLNKRFKLYILAYDAIKKMIINWNRYTMWDWDFWATKPPPWMWKIKQSERFAADLGLFSLVTYS